MSSFQLIRTQAIPSLNLEVQEYEHLQTGAKHYHLASEQEEKVFLVAFRTNPQDSTGVAHILEHTALCGSANYPVRDPFFMMTRRSLNTFMNAFTSSDWTAYPFASQNTKDFNNLLDVYLDAAFFSRLDPLDFAQEGHRMEFKQADDPNSDLVYKGVVYNEMKGAMSSPTSALWQTFTKYLFPETTYHHNSGGEPASIPDLTYAQLQDFYATHYHPSNAIFMTFGKLDLTELHNKIHTQALSKFERSAVHLSVPNEKRYLAPVRIEEAYALEQEDLKQQTHHVLGWLLGPSIDLDALMQATLLERLLLDNSSSPLLAALESSDLGTGPSPLCGLEDSNREMSFMCGLAGSEPEHAAAVEELILTTLEKVAQEGIDQSSVEAQLHQLELSQREITGDGMPFGLQLILAGLGAAIHRGDPVEVLNLDPALTRLREAIQEPNFIPQLVRQLLLDNQHRVRLTLRPDNQLAERQEAAEAERLALIKDSLSSAEKQQLVNQAQALAARQMQQDDADLLPKVGLEDVPLKLELPQQIKFDQAGRSVNWFTAGTNGLVYAQTILDLPAFSPTEQELLPLFTYCLTELGCQDRDYRANQALQSQVAGSLTASYTLRSSLASEQETQGYFVISGKALASKQNELQQLMAQTLADARFDELERIAEIIAQRNQRLSNSITGRGHLLAMQAAKANLSPSSNFEQRTSGLNAIQLAKKLAQRIQNPTELAALAQELQAMHAKLQQAPRQFLVIGEQEQQANLLKSVEQNWPSFTAPATWQSLNLPSTRETVQQVWQTSTQVNFCAIAFPTVIGQHADAAALTVLANYLRNGYLHRAIREQGGAYGAGAMQDSNAAAFCFYSYRDPRAEETLNDFYASLDWLAEQPIDAQKLEEAILGVIASIDKPGSPAGEAKQTFMANLYGRTPELRQALRAKVLKVTAEDLQRVAETYLRPDLASRVLITNSNTAAKLDASYNRLEV